MTELSTASLSQVRQILTEAIKPDKLLLFRRGSGSIHLRVLSTRFEGVADPLAMVEGALAERGLQLPVGVMPHLRAPSEVVGDEEEQALFRAPPVETPTWPAALEMESTGEVPSDDRGLGATEVVAFWGLKGGVGRTTSLAHVATWFGRQGRRVLAVDLDLDSPGLLAVLAEPLRDGVTVDDELRFDQLLIDAQDPSLDDATLRARLERALRRARGDLPRVDLLGPELADERFIKNLLGPLRPDRLYRGAQPALRRVLRLAASAASADIILLDVRSGYCEESAIAVLDLADQVVVFASPTTGTYGSLAPVFSALERRHQGAGRPGVLHVVAGMLPAGKEARDRILSELPLAYLQARQDIYDALGGEVGVLPSDLSVIPVYYSDLVVENGSGVGMSLESLGYGELCERIQVTLWPPAPTQPQTGASSSLKKILEEVEIPEASAESEPDIARLLELFTRTPDTEELLRRSRTLVLGAKGTGKTYLRRVCLEDPALLRAPQTMRFVDAYSIPRNADPASHPISSEMMIELDRSADQLGWRNLWSAIAAFRVLKSQPTYAPAVDLTALSLAVGSTSAGELVQALCRAAANPLALDEVWTRIDVLARQRGEDVVLLFDDLDVVLGRARETEPRRQAMLVGLLDRVMASWLTRRALSAKVFLRDDLMRGLPLQDRSKLEQSALKLNWRTEDIWRMLVRAMGVGSRHFKARLNQDSIKLSDLDNLQVERFVGHLDFLWGHRMGAASNTSATRTLAWVEKRLMDGTERLFPRAALWLLDESLKEQKKRGAPANPPLIGPPALRAAMPEVAGRRLTELHNESTEAEWEQINRLKGCDSFLSQPEMVKHLGKSGEAQPEEAIKALRELGIIELVKKGDQLFERIVDLYAFAPELEIKRLGRR